WLPQEFFVGLLEILNEFLFIRLRIVNETTEFIEALLAKAMKHDVDRGALFANEQHAFAAGDVIRNQVRDRLQFAGAGRALNNVTVTGSGARDGRGLRGVASDDEMLFAQIERRRRGDFRSLRRERKNRVKRRARHVRLD